MMTNLYRACGKHELKKLLLVEFVMFCKQLTIMQSSVKLCFRLEASSIHYVILVIVTIGAFCNIHSIAYKLACSISSSNCRVYSWWVGDTVGNVLVQYCMVCLFFIYLFL